MKFYYVSIVSLMFVNYDLSNSFFRMESECTFIRISKRLQLSRIFCKCKFLNFANRFLFLLYFFNVWLFYSLLKTVLILNFLPVLYIFESFGLYGLLFLFVLPLCVFLLIFTNVFPFFSLFFNKLYWVVFVRSVNFRFVFS